MACLRKLKEDLALLEQLFPKHHERLQVIVVTVDEIIIRFCDNGGRASVINANIQLNYPREPTVWYCEDDNEVMASALERLNKDVNSTNLLFQTHRLCLDLCHHFGLPVPKELRRIAPPDQMHLNAESHLSVLVQKPLRKELRDYYKNRHTHENYTIELQDDCVDKWWVKLHKVDPDSLLHTDMITLAQEHNQDHLLFEFIFNDQFPYQPPFVRLVSPMINYGHVMNGGAICMELLTRHGWSAASSIEGVILQIAVSLVKGKARIQFDGKNGYSLNKAQHSYKSFVQMYGKNDWYTPPKSDG